MAGRQRTSFEKRERERKRQEKQAAKRARRHHDGQPSPEDSGRAPDASGDVSDAERIQSAEG
jgi:hypothetical protein